MISFSRAELASELVTALQGKAHVSDAHNALYLAAPLRTGKTSLLRNDLSPAPRAAGVAVGYVDFEPMPPAPPAS
ncbi:hypothetical protein SAMN05421829_10718 [Aromatoleum tolulyticum]|uniref:Uncharacterized protein n=1 Tax=Aromatoleum tolulyticum TaxID=34027 RepID=A0A1N6VTX2_9RHOO|nr:hypothetical protein [Aromatoleum tolulyticum]SIQ81299.1 hypothetical protein SAMN05421829_10718 [Aromatoleum tolulyticum]